MSGESEQVNLGLSEVLAPSPTSDKQTWGLAPETRVLGFQTFMRPLDLAVVS